MEKISDHELLVELKTAITAEIDERVGTYLDDHPHICKESAEDDVIDDFLYELENMSPKIHSALVTIMRQDGYSI